MRLFDARDGYYIQDNALFDHLSFLMSHGRPFWELRSVVTTDVAIMDWVMGAEVL